MPPAMDFLTSSRTKAAVYSEYITPHKERHPGEGHRLRVMLLNGYVHRITIQVEGDACSHFFHDP